MSSTNCEASYVRALVQPCATKFYDAFTVYVHRLFSPIAHQSEYISYPSHFLKYRATETIRLSSCCCSPWVKKTRHQTLSHNFTNYYPIFKFFSLKDSVVNLQQTPFKNSTTLETCRYTTLWNINVTKWHHSQIRIAINDDSQGSIAKNLRCDE